MKDEQQYNEFIQKQVKNSEELHYADIEHNKDQLWSRIEERLKKKKVIPLWFYSAAASFVLLMGLGLVFNQKILNKNIEIEKLQAELDAKNEKIATISNTSYEVVKIVDTVKIVNEKIVYLPVKSYEKVIVHDTIINTLKVTDTVYIHQQKEVAKFVVNDENEEQNNQQITVNTNPVKKKKNRRFIFLFGKQKEETHQTENTRLITLRTK